MSDVVVSPLTEQLERLWLTDFARGSPYRFSYFSGSQIAIFLGDIFIDEAVFLAYELQHTRRPVYGYASAYWNAVLDGVVVVQGRLAVNYVDNRYLTLSIFDHLRRRQEGAGIPRAAEGFTQMEMLSSLAAHNLLHEPGRRQFALVAQTLRRRYWQEDMGSNRLTPRPDQFPGVDIYVTFGLAGPQQPVKKLEQVVFIGESQVIEISGQPVLEIYNFLARRVVNPLPPVTD